MKYSIASLLFFFLACCSQSSLAQINFDSLIKPDLPVLENVYKQLHANPELSGHEENTSAFIAKELTKLGYTVTEHAGKFSEKPWKGYGVIAIMKNGDGPTTLVRTDMDALPVVEKTGLPYASTVKTTNEAGEQAGVMHACGHDIHMTCFLEVAKLIAKLKGRWKGTVMLVAQPAEEGGPGGSGAEALLKDELYTRFPRPDFTLGLHQTPALVAGKVGVIKGYTNAVSGGGEILVRGIGAHPSKPQDSKDPIVFAAQLVIALQTIVSRETDPLEPATLTIGAIHGGVAENVIPDEVRLKLTLRALNPQVFDQMIRSINRITKGLAIAAGIPDNKMPLVTIKQAYPANYNDADLTDRLTGVFKKVLGNEQVETIKPLLTGEDFSYYSLNRTIPNMFFMIGSADPDKYKESVRTGVALPGNHSPYMMPVTEPTIKTGVIAMTSAVLELLKKN